MDSGGYNAFSGDGYEPDCGGWTDDDPDEESPSLEILSSILP